MAASDHPEKGKLIRQVLLASASIPGVFPPVYIEVETPDGRKYDEMHVDGGVSSQMFFYPAQVNWKDVMDVLDVKGTPTIYLIRTQGIGDFYRIATLADRDGLDFEITWIPEGTNESLGVTPTEEFDPKYMKALFEFSQQLTLKGETWTNFFELLEMEKN